jgi:hypothetical protein
MSESEGADFWAWFQQHSLSLAANDPDAVAGLGERLQTLGLVYWELGPGEAAGTSFLAFGMDDDSTRRSASTLCERAPLLAGWEFRLGKPRKQWDGRLLWGVEKVQVDARAWRFLVFRYADGMHEITLVRPRLPAAIKDQAQALAVFVVEAELGQDDARRLVCKIAVDKNVDTAQRNSTLGMRDLRRALRLAPG